MSGTRCSTCGADVGERAICPRCGTLIGVERGLAKLTAGARSYTTDWLTTLPRRLSIHHFLWLCAVMPVVVLPPLASLGFALLSMRHRDNTAPGINAEWLAIISFLNIVLSLLLLYKLHFSPYEVAAFIRDIVHSLLGSILRVVPDGGGYQSPRVIPI
jgi:hypothetical protein